MATGEKRDYLYRGFAQDPDTRVNLGIRRRLAPLLGNDRRLIDSRRRWQESSVTRNRPTSPSFPNCAPLRVLWA
jgi:hypothetical protein